MSSNLDKVVKLACKPKNAPPKSKVSSRIFPSIIHLHVPPLERNTSADSQYVEYVVLSR